MMEGTISKGLGIALAVVFLSVALLIFGNLGTGTGSFWYGVNNPNTSKLNTTSGLALGAGTIDGAVNVIEATAVPILIAVGVAAGLIMGILKAMGVI